MGSEVDLHISNKNKISLTDENHEQELQGKMLNETETCVEYLLC